MTIQGLHPFWQKVCHLNPVFYLINGYRYSMVGVSDVDLTTIVIVSLLATGVTYLMAMYSLLRGSFARW